MYIYCLALSILLAACGREPTNFLNNSERTKAYALANESDMVFDDTRVHEVRLTLSEEAVAILRQQTDRLSPRVDVPMTLSFNGEKVDGETHLRGSIGSFRDFDNKPGFKIKFKERFHGLKSLELHNLVQDPAFASTHHAYGIFRALGQPARRVTWTTLYVNDLYFGMYSVVESINKDFIKRWFPEASNGNLYKCAAIFRHCEFGDSSDWEKETNEDDPNRAELDHITALLASTPEEELVRALEPLFDTENFRTLWAVSDLAWHWDGYISLPTNNNYYVYHEPHQNKFYLIPSGMDSCFRHLDKEYLDVTSRIAPYLRGLDDAPDAYPAVRASIKVEFLQSGELITESERIHQLLTPYLYNQPRHVDSRSNFEKIFELNKEFIRTRK